MRAFLIRPRLKWLLTSVCLNFKISREKVFVSNLLVKISRGWMLRKTAQREQGPLSFHKTFQQEWSQSPNFMSYLLFYFSFIDLSSFTKKESCSASTAGNCAKSDINSPKVLSVIFEIKPNQYHDDAQYFETSSFSHETTYLVTLTSFDKINFIVIMHTHW